MVELFDHVTENHPGLVKKKKKVTKRTLRKTTRKK
jgi:hypothetical protein